MQVIVYAGAIVVLFLFVIMFLGVDRKEDIAKENLRRPATAGLRHGRHHAGRPVRHVRHRALGHRRAPCGRARSPGHITNVNLLGEVAQLGRQLFTTYLFAFEATAALLVIAVVGAVVLARRPPVAQDPERERAESELSS